MDFSSFEDNIESFRTLFENIATDTGVSEVYYGVRWIGGLALTFLLMRSAVLSLSSPGERPIKWFEDIIKPLLLLVVLLNWITIMNLIGNISESISTTLGKAAKTEKVQTSITADFRDQADMLLGRAWLENVVEEDKMRKSEEAYNSGEKSNARKDENIFDQIAGGIDDFGESAVLNPISSLYNEMKEIIRDARIESAYALSSLAITIQNLVSIMFYGYAGIVLELLKIFGAIALVLSYFPSMQQSFFTWLRNFIAVHMWLAVAAIIFYIVDLMYIETIRIIKADIAENAGVAMTGLNGRDIEFSGDFSEHLAWFRKQAWVFIAFGILKGILMFKIPSFVSMFIGSTSSSGGMFAAVFAPIKMAGGGASSVASGGASAASRLTGK